MGESKHDLHYLLARESLAEREAGWAAFQTDPECIARRAEPEKDGPIMTDAFLPPTAFSSVK